MLGGENHFRAHCRTLFYAPTPTPTDGAGVMYLVGWAGSWMGLCGATALNAGDIVGAAYLPFPPTLPPPKTPSTMDTVPFHADGLVCGHSSGACRQTMQP